MLDYLHNTSNPASADLTDAAAKDAADKYLAVLYKAVGGKAMHWGYSYPPQMPLGAAFGIKSNIMTYGPWISQGPAGQVAVELDEGLVPWEYNGFTYLNLAANSKADSSVTEMQFGEVGTIAVPGYPTVPLGAELGAVNNGFYGAPGQAGTSLVENRSSVTTTNFNENHAVSGPFSADYVNYDYSANGWTGLYGPNVSSISTSVGSNGAQTTYSMRTFSPKFGRMSKYNAEVLKKISKTNRNQLRTLKNYHLQVAKTKLFQRATRDKPLGNEGVGQGRTPHECFVGEIVPWTGPTANDTGNFSRTPIVTETLDSLPNEYEGYDSKAFMSLDGLVRPVSMDGDGNLPQYGSIGIETEYNPLIEPPYSISGSGTTGGVAINIGTTNPLTNPTGVGGSYNGALSYCDSTCIGHDIEILGRRNTPPTTGTGGWPTGYVSMVMPPVGYNSTDKSDYTPDYRFMALRSPLILHGWGYDTLGRPIPNSNDFPEGVPTGSGSISGDFSSPSGTLKFVDEWLRKPETWPVGPVDLRWDRNRSMWVAPPAYSMARGVLQHDWCTSTGTAMADAITDAVLYDGDGSGIPVGTGNAEFEVSYPGSHARHIPSGATVVADYANGIYTLVEVADYHFTVESLGTTGIDGNALGEITSVVPYSSSLVGGTVSLAGVGDVTAGWSFSTVGSCVYANTGCSGCNVSVHQPLSYPHVWEEGVTASNSTVTIGNETKDVTGPLCDDTVHVCYPTGLNVIVEYHYPSNGWKVTNAQCDAVALAGAIP
jgi:hypothetical protein